MSSYKKWNRGEVCYVIYNPATGLYYGYCWGSIHKALKWDTIGPAKCHITRQNRYYRYGPPGQIPEFANCQIVEMKQEYTPTDTPPFKISIGDSKKKK